MIDTLSMSDGTQVKTLEELREHFDLISVLEHYTSGNLLEWLKSLHCEEEADAVAAMNPFMPEFEKTLCGLFHVPFSLEQMMAAYEKAASENCAEAQFRLGCCYLFGYGVIIHRGRRGYTRKNNEKIAKGAALTRQAAEQGHLFAQYSLGNYYLRSQGFDAAATWYQKAAEQGYIPAVYSTRTIEGYLQAAEQGHARAQAQLGKAFFYGSGVEQDYQKAAKWYRKAAEQGDMEAEYRLCLCYITGTGVEKDEEEAEKWCSRAGETDSFPGEFWIGECFFYGCEVKQDFSEAEKWYHRAYVKNQMSWQTINKLDLCRAVLRGEKLTYRYIDSPEFDNEMYTRGYWRSKEEYNNNVEWLLSGGANGGIQQCPFHSLYAIYGIPSDGPEDDVEALWCWRLTHRNDKQGQT